jgi:ribosomal-protein-alanine N-acetyltransferase
MKIRRFAPTDLSAVVDIQKQVLPDGEWTENDFLRLGFSPGGLILVAEADQDPSCAVVGLVAARQIGTEAEILILAVADHHQRQGAGRLLLDAIWKELEKIGVKHMYLEVRASNRAAINLYTSAGFTLNFVRRNYYAQPLEDAYVMSLEIPVSIAQKTPAPAIDI